MDTLRVHHVRLADGDLRLRPMHEGDWPLLWGWNNDPRVREGVERNPGWPASIDDLAGVYRAISRTALCFIVEHAGAPIGECWLQAMNLDRLRARYPDEDSRRIDIAIDPEHWGRGLGSRTIRLLVEYAFGHERADRVFACDVQVRNARSIAAFRAAGFTLDAPARAGGADTCDLAITRAEWTERRPR